MFCNGIHFYTFVIFLLLMLNQNQLPTSHLARQSLQPSQLGVFVKLQSCKIWSPQCVSRTDQKIVTLSFLCTPAQFASNVSSEDLCFEIVISIQNPVRRYPKLGAINHSPLDNVVATKCWYRDDLSELRSHIAGSSSQRTESDSAEE